MEQHNIKSTLTDNISNDRSEEQKSLYLIKCINTNLVYTCLANFRVSVALCDDFSAAACHFSDFLVIMKSRDPVSNRNILGA